MTSIVIPRLAGTRERAGQVSSSLPESLSGLIVTIDAQDVASASQSFSDELCKQILVDRDASRLDVHNASPQLARYLNTSARIRGVAVRLVVDVRP